MGASIGMALEGYIVGFEEFEELLRERRSLRMKRRPPTAGKIGGYRYISIYQDNNSNRLPMYVHPNL